VGAGCNDLRPCSRCVENGLEATCADVPRKKRATRRKPPTDVSRYGAASAASLALIHSLLLLADKGMPICPFSSSFSSPSPSPSPPLLVDLGSLLHQERIYHPELCVTSFLPSLFHSSLGKLVSCQQTNQPANKQTKQIKSNNISPTELAPARLRWMKWPASSTSTWLRQRARGLATARRAPWRSIRWVGHSRPSPHIRCGSKSNHHLPTFITTCSTPPSSYTREEGRDHHPVHPAQAK